MRRFIHITMAIAMLATASVAWADKGKGKDKDDGEESDRGSKARLFEAQLLRVADLGTGGLGAPFPAPGSDRLGEGEVEVKASRRVEVEIEGAVANTSYDVMFCRLPAQCFALIPATLATNSAGNAKAEFELPAGMHLVGFFLFSRGGASQFASGFGFPPAAVDPGVEVELRGTISSINLANQTFRLENFLVDIVVNANTRLPDRFTDLRVGQTAEVRGIAANGMITATRVRLERD